MYPMGLSNSNYKYHGLPGKRSDSRMLRLSSLALDDILLVLKGSGERM